MILRVPPRDLQPAVSTTSAGTQRERQQSKATPIILHRRHLHGDAGVYRDTGDTEMNMQHLTLPIYNLGCGGEGRTVEALLMRVPGVTHVYVNPATEMAYVEYDPALSDATYLFAVLDRAGFGQPAGRSDRQTAPAPTPRHTLDVRRMALAGGIWLAGLYTVCIVAHLLFPNVTQMDRVWELLLIGVTWAEPRMLVLGLAEIFVYGALGSGAFAALYNLLPARARATPAAIRRDTQPQRTSRASTFKV
jgi:copper chaperone CopZ